MNRLPPLIPFVPRERRICEVFELACYNCNHEIQIPVSAVVNCVGHCPSCGVELRVEWSSK